MDEPHVVQGRRDPRVVPERGLELELKPVELVRLPTVTDCVVQESQLLQDEVFLDPIAGPPAGGAGLEEHRGRLLVAPLLMERATEKGEGGPVSAVEASVPRDLEQHLEPFLRLGGASQLEQHEGRIVETDAVEAMCAGLLRQGDPPIVEGQGLLRARRGVVTATGVDPEALATFASLEVPSSIRRISS